MGAALLAHGTEVGTAVKLLRGARWVWQGGLTAWLCSPCRACYGVLRFIMESGAKGCEVVVSGKLRGQRAKSMKFVDGLMIHSGDPVNYYVDTAVRHVLLRQGECLPCSSLCSSAASLL